MFERRAARRVDTHADNAADKHIAGKTSRTGARNFRSHLYGLRTVTWLGKAHAKLILPLHGERTGRDALLAQRGAHLRAFRF